jgi:plastocyanin
MSAARRALYLLAAASVALTACSNSQSPINRTALSGSAAASDVGGVQQITLKAGDDYRFHPATFTVHPGRVQVILEHTGTGAPHNWELTDFPADFVPLAAAGQTKTATFDAPAPGRYQFVCTIHVKQGQVGTMIVTSR